MAIAIAAFVLWSTSHLMDWPRVCREELATVGDAPTVQVCGPMEAEALLGTVLLIAMLLLPDVSELAIPNLITLKRRVERQDEEQGRIREDLARVEQVQIAQQNVSVNVAPYVPPDWDRIKQDLQSQLDDAKELVSSLRGAVSSEASGHSDSARTPERDTLEIDLLRLWRPIERVLLVRPNRRGPLVRDSRPEPAELEFAHRFEDLFRTEIRAVRAVRNAVVHEPERVATEDLQEAVDVARKLNDALDGLRT